MVNNKGYIRTLEAVFAILIVFGVIIFTIQGNRERDVGSPALVDSSQRFVLDTLSFDLALRTCVVNGTKGNDGVGEPYNGLCNATDFTMNLKDLPRAATTFRISNFIRNVNGEEIIFCGEAIGNLIEENMPSGYYYICEVCNSPLSCLSSEEGKNIPSDGRSVFTKTLFLAISEGNIREKVIRLYYWKCDKDESCIF